MISSTASFKDYRDINALKGSKYGCLPSPSSEHSRGEASKASGISLSTNHSSNSQHHQQLYNYSLCGLKWSVNRRRKKMDDWLTVWSGRVGHLFLLPTSLLGLGPPMERVICQIRKFTVTGLLLLKWKPQHVSSKRHCSHVREYTLAGWIHLCTGATASV